MDKEQLNALMATAGITSSSGGLNWANIIGGLIFGTIGMVAFMFGKKEKRPKPLVTGIVLMAYPYFVSNTVLLYLIGTVLSAVLFFWRD